MTSKSLEHLLKSSLPLEQHVAEIALKVGLQPCGEFSYLRKNENGSDAEFSIDVLANASYSAESSSPGIDLNVLLECKYASRAVEWVFSAIPQHEPITYSSTYAFHWFGTHFLESKQKLNELEPKDYCTRGISLSPSSADPKPIRHGLQQLRYAVPHLLDRITTLYVSDFDEHPIPVITSMLVTNAPIRVMKPGLSLSDIEEAKSLDDITQRKEIVCIYQPAGPELLEACQDIAKKIFTKYKSVDRPHITQDFIFESLVESVQSISIVSLSRLKTHLEDIRSALSSAKTISHQDFAERYMALSGKN